MGDDGGVRRHCATRRARDMDASSGRRASSARMSITRNAAGNGKSTSEGASSPVVRARRTREGSRTSLSTSSEARARKNVEAIVASRVEKDKAKVNEERYVGEGFRLVRCMPHLKRREADDAVSAMRVRVNGEVVKPSRRVVAGDVVTLDGKTMNWEPHANAVEREIAGDEGNGFVYLAYHKARGVVSTMEGGRTDSLASVLERELAALRARVFPVGRLDKDSSGLVLLTNDGRVSDALLDPARKAEKEYDVQVHKTVADADVERLAAGVVITTTQQRGMEETTAPTAPCEVRKTGPKTLKFFLKEGRNRQIRKMCEALGYEVTRLHRVRIDALHLGDLEEGCLRMLDAEEMKAISERVASRAKPEAVSAANTSTEGRRRKAAIANEPTGWGAKIYKESHPD